MNGTEKRQRPTTAHVLLRPCDRDSVCLILECMRTMGLLVGKGTVSDAIRYAIDIAASSITYRGDCAADNHSG